MFKIVGEIFGGREEVYDNASLVGPSLSKNSLRALHVHNGQEADEAAMDGGGGVHNIEHACDEDLYGSALEQLEGLHDELCFERIPCFLGNDCL